MAVSIQRTSVVARPNASVNLSSLIKVTADGANPTYLTIIGLDREAYPAGSGGPTGALFGNNQSAQFSPIYGDSDYFDNAVFTYDSSSNRYYSQQYGYLDQMVYKTSSSANDFTQLTVFTSNSWYMANEFVTEAYYMFRSGWNWGEIGSIGIANQVGAASPPNQATPDGLAAIAKTFVGKQWNVDGCWVLADTIATEAGAALPCASAYSGLMGQPTGEWTEVFDGPAGQTGNWQSLVTTGDVIVIGNPQTGMSHVTTCVSGSGATAKLVDNIALYDLWGNPINPSTDGSWWDITIASPVSANLEWSQAATSDVVIYRLDTPVVAAKASSYSSLRKKATENLSDLFSVSDPGNQAITKVEFYASPGSIEGFRVNNGPLQTHFHNSANYGQADSLAAVTLVAGALDGTDTIRVRAENAEGYWGDWQTAGVAVGKIWGSVAKATSGAVSATATALNNQYDALVQGVAGLQGVVGGGELVSHNPPPSAALQLAGSLLHG